MAIDKAGHRAGILLAIAAVLATTVGSRSEAYDGLVEKKVFSMPAYSTVGGETIKNVQIGWESYGQLNEAKDNAILITHFFSGTSHAAGRYRADDARPGYWDAIIGADKPIDTDRFFVLSSDTLVNLNVHAPMVTTTGPASIDPTTGEPYGLDFPIVGIRDFVNVQKALLESLGIDRLHAVVGASMGALQAIEWGAGYPDMVDRVVAVIGGAEADAFLIGWLNLWAAPIRLDPNWNGGDYYDGPAPTAGLTEALKLVTLQARAWPWAVDTFGRTWAVEDRNPAASFDNYYEVEAWLTAAASARAAVSDANHFLYLVKANQTFIANGGPTLADGLRGMTMPVLLLPAVGDLIFFPELATAPMAEMLEAQGTAVTVADVDGPLGHLNGIAFTGAHGDLIRRFLTE